MFIIAARYPEIFSRFISDEFPYRLDFEFRDQDFLVENGKEILIRWENIFYATSSPNKRIYW
jgi:hypothetical protein